MNVRGMAALLGAGIAAAAMGCAGPDAEHVPMEVGPLDVFRRSVQPHLEARCAQGGCHGRPDRPLALYASGIHRQDPARLYLDEPLTDAELRENARRMAAFAQTTDPSRSLALRKPLAMAADGCWHGGGEVFADTTDPAYRALHAWLGMAGWGDGGAP